MESAPSSGISKKTMETKIAHAWENERYTKWKTSHENPAPKQDILQINDAPNSVLPPGRAQMSTHSALTAHVPALLVINHSQKLTVPRVSSNQGVSPSKPRTRPGRPSNLRPIWSTSPTPGVWEKKWVPGETAGSTGPKTAYRRCGGEAHAVLTPQAVEW